MAATSRSLREWTIPFMSPSPPPGTAAAPVNMSEFLNRPADPAFHYTIPGTVGGTSGDRRACAEVICTNECLYLPSDGNCNDRFSDDGAPVTCALGTDCADCGFRCCEDDLLFVGNESGKNCAWFRDQGPGSCTEYPEAMRACPVSCNLCNPPSGKIPFPQRSQLREAIDMASLQKTPNVQNVQNVPNVHIPQMDRVPGLEQSEPQWGSAHYLAMGAGASLSVGALLFWSARRTFLRPGRPGPGRPGPGRPALRRVRALGGCEEQL